MYKVFLADDEQYIVDGLRVGIPWEAQGFAVCGTAGDGETALAEIERLRPDAVFTDIRMPCLSGLELIARIKERLPGTFLVVITGHAEFEYAKKAIEHGVDGYTLKPIEREEIVAHLAKFRAVLDRRLAEARSSSLMEAIENDDGAAFAACLPGGVAQCILANGGRLAALEDRGAAGVCRLARDQWLYVSSQEHSAQRLAAMADAGVLGIGAVTHGAAQGPPSAFVSEAILRSYGYFMDPKARIRTTGYESGARHRYLLLLGLLSRQALKKDSAAAEATLESLRELLGEVSIAELSRSWGVHDALCSLDGGDEEHPATGGFHALVERWPDALACFADFAKGIRGAILPPPDRAPTGTDNRLVSEVIGYLREHTRESPTPFDVAARFNVGHAHLSRLFKKETGLAFSKYVTLLKMERSRTLLAKTGLSVNDVAQESGYVDYLYFRKVFKKQHGVTPTEYRRQQAR